MEIIMHTSFKSFVVATTTALAIGGTGGMYTNHNLSNLYQWYDNSAIFPNDPSFSDQVLSPAEQIASIRDTLQLNMSDLASLLRVSRPTAYGWLDGKEPSAESQKHISTLAMIANRVNSLNIIRMDLLIHRPIFGGKSLLDQLINQENVTDSLQVLKNISDKEFANRRNSKSSSKSITPMNEAASHNSIPIYRS